MLREQRSVDDVTMSWPESKECDCGEWKSGQLGEGVLYPMIVPFGHRHPDQDFRLLQKAPGPNWTIDKGWQR